MRSLLVTFLLGIFFCGRFSGAVSRVGGGSCSNHDTEGFTYSTPRRFAASPVFADDSVQYSSGFGMGPAGASQTPAPEIINQYVLRSEIPALAGVNDRPQFERYFLSRHWTQRPGVDPCQSIFIYSDSSGYSVVAGWGGGKGVVFVGPDRWLVRDGIDEAISSLVLDPGACAWK